MPRPSQGSIPSDLGWLVDMLDDYERRLRTLEAPSGEALGNTVAKLSALVSNIQDQLDAYMAGRYTNAQIDAKDAAVAALIDSKIAAAFAGNVSIGGTLTVAGAVTMPDVYNTNIVGLGGSRKTVWVRDGGRMGNTA